MLAKENKALTDKFKDFQTQMHCSQDKLVKQLQSQLEGKSSQIIDLQTTLHRLKTEYLQEMQLKEQKLESS